MLSYNSISLPMELIDSETFKESKSLGMVLRRATSSTWCLWCENTSLVSPKGKQLRSFVMISSNASPFLGNNVNPGREWVRVTFIHFQCRPIEADSKISGKQPGGIIFLSIISPLHSKPQELLSNLDFWLWVAMSTGWDVPWWKGSGGEWEVGRREPEEKETQGSSRWIEFTGYNIQPPSLILRLPHESICPSIGAAGLHKEWSGVMLGVSSVSLILCLEGRKNIKDHQEWWNRSGTKSQW